MKFVKWLTRSLVVGIFLALFLLVVGGTVFVIYSLVEHDKSAGSVTTSVEVSYVDVLMFTDVAYVRVEGETAIEFIDRVTKELESAVKRSGASEIIITYNGDGYSGLTSARIVTKLKVKKEVS